MPFVIEEVNSKGAEPGLQTPVIKYCGNRIMKDASVNEPAVC